MKVGAEVPNTLVAACATSESSHWTTFAVPLASVVATGHCSSAVYRFCSASSAGVSGRLGAQKLETLAGARGIALEQRVDEVVEQDHRPRVRE
jgi:hypothetical protein